MVELSDPKGPYQEGISNSIFIIPGIIVVIFVGTYSSVWVANLTVNNWTVNNCINDHSNSIKFAYDTIVAPVLTISDTSVTTGN